jgi:hypothetical protein
MKREGSKDHIRGQVIAVTGAIALGLTPTSTAAGRIPAIDRDPPGRTETATFALG